MAERMFANYNLVIWGTTSTSHASCPSPPWCCLSFLEKAWRANEPVIQSYTHRKSSAQCLADASPQCLYPIAASFPWKCKCEHSCPPTQSVWFLHDFYK
jgi:hypothetical protein